MPTDALRVFRDVAFETKSYGWDNMKVDFQKLGVIVSYVSDNTMFGKFKGKGMQIAGGVPFMLGEPSGMHTFRIGLFGIDKVYDIQKTVSTLEKTLDEILEEDAAEAKAAA